MSTSPIVVVGASLAGISTVDALRMRGCSRPIILIGAEPHLPYDRPPLSKGYLAADAAPVPTYLRDDSRVTELDVDLVLGTRAVELDVERSLVLTDTADEVAYGDLVIATGAAARPNPVPTDLAGFHVLRTVDDAAGLRRDLDDSEHVVVLGAGFIGAEVAAAARKRDLSVTMVERLPQPMSAALGPEVGALLARMHTEEGVDVRCGVTVTAARGSGRVEEVRLSDGTIVPADLVVVGLGVTPATEWLEGSGLKLDDGVVCDEHLRAAGQEHVYAVGDVARWPHPLFGEPVRIEHWTNATDHAEVVASQLVGTGKVADTVPYVWSDQYGHRIQVVGRPGLADAITVREEPVNSRHVAVYVRAGVVVGVLTIDAPRVMVMGRKAVAGRWRAAELIAQL